MEGLLVHGGALDRMQRLYPGAPKPWVDLSTGINPWPYILPKIDLHAWTRLPTKQQVDSCRRAMADYFGAPPEAVLPSPGSEILISLLPQLLTLKRVAILTPSYSDHARAWRRSGCNVIEASDPFALAAEVDAVVICNPNNPDGKLFDHEHLTTVHQTLRDRGKWLIVDEAYSDLCPALSVAQYGGEDGLIVMRSFGKFFGLAGIRLGALIAPEDVIGGMAALLGHWGISGPALEIGTVAYRDKEWVEQTRKTLCEVRSQLDIVLRDVGLELKGGTDLFRFVYHPQASDVWIKLAQNGLYTRRFEWSDTYLRVGLPASEDALLRLSRALSL